MKFVSLMEKKDLGSILDFNWLNICYVILTVMLNLSALEFVVLFNNIVMGNTNECIAIKVPPNNF